jgi:UDP-galactopyranose mutase
MNTFYQLWGTITPAEAIAKIKEQKEGFVLDLNGEPSNLEEMAISLVGSDIYNILIKGYTEKQWGRKATELPSFIIKRIPVRFTFDNNYFSDKYQGIPIGGYTKLIQKMLSGVEVKLNYDYFEHKENIQQNTKKLIYTGPIDRYYDYKYGELEYRSLDFKTEKLDIENYQGCAVINFTDAETPFTRIIEHKHFDYVDTDFTLITKEYPQNWDRSKEAYYPVNNEKNMHVYKQYAKLVKQEVDVIFGGRLAEYKYYDMHQVIRSALHTIQKITALS